MIQSCDIMEYASLISNPDIAWHCAFWEAKHSGEGFSWERMEGACLSGRDVLPKVLRLMEFESLESAPAERAGFQMQCDRYR